MRIKETVERECCESRDLKPVIGAPKVETGRVSSVLFCVHCGRRHKYTTFMDEAGSRDWTHRPVGEEWEGPSR